MSTGIFGTDLAASAATVAQSLGGSATNGVSARTAALGGAANSASATSPGTSSGDISSNDFLTLLVTEMKNQDPTQPTDPNAYIQQLTEVNSLQQLIAINHDLTPAAPTGAASTTAVGGVGGA